MTVRKSSMLHAKKSWCLAALAGLLSLPLFAFAQSTPNPPSNLCIDGSSDCGTVSPPTSNGKRWNPGHYMLLYEGDDNWVGRCNEIAGEANVPGILIRPKWDQIETSKGAYNWSTTDAVVNACRAVGKNVFFLIIDRTFGGSPNANGCRAPQYVKNLDGGTGCMATVSGGTPALHKAQVMDRLIAFFQAIAAKYDSNDGFGGVMPEESAPNFGDVSRPSDYTQGGYASQLARMYSESAAAFDEAIFVTQINYLKGYVDFLIDSANAANAAFGGPDIYPSDCASGTTAAQSYYATNYRGVMPGMHQQQAAAMGGRKGDCSVAQISTEGQSIGLSYYFWLRKSGGAGIRWTEDILPAIRSGLPYESDCPTNFAAGCQ